MSGPTQTYYCLSCSNLFDESQELTIGSLNNKCNECQSDHLVEWFDGQPCPNCHGQLEKDPDGVIALAD